MRSFIVKNRFFVALLSIALIIIAFLSVYTIRKNMDMEPDTPAANQNEPVDDQKNAEITAMSAKYTRSATGIAGNVITVSWAYNPHSQNVDAVYLYLNDTKNGINVTKYSFYDFTQGVYDYPTGVNKIRLELHLSDGTIVKEEKEVFVQYIISTKQTAAFNKNSVDVTLEYVYNNINPVEIPEILITNTENNLLPNVSYIDTKTEVKGNKTTAKTTYRFTWNSEADMADKVNVRWKFTSITDSFDYNFVKP